MGTEARADVRELLGFRIVHRELTAGRGQRVQLRRRMARSLFAVVRVVRRAHGRRDPDPALGIEHGIVHVVLAVPDHFVAPVGRGLLHHRPLGRLRFRIANGQLHLTCRVVHRVENREVIRAELQRPEERSRGVDRRIPAIGRDLVVEIRLRVGPVPLGNHDVALDPLRPGRRGWDLARRNPVSPVGEHRQRPRAAHLVEAAAHLRTGLSGQDAPVPRGR